MSVRIEVIATDIRSNARGRRFPAGLFSCHEFLSDVVGDRFTGGALFFLALLPVVSDR
jgi:hypothetical protein